MSWHEALAWALTGQHFDLKADAPDPVELLAQLAELGWPSERIRRHAGEVIEKGGHWPHPIPGELRQGLGAAQLAANIALARKECQLEVRETRPPSPRTELNADERRLMSEVPPHY